MPERQQCQSSEQLLEFFRCNANDFLLRLVTMDETWLYHYDPETRQSNDQWSGGIAAHPAPPCSQKLIPSAKIRCKGSRIDFLIDYLPKGQTTNADYYSFLLVQLKDILKEKGRPREGHQGSLVLARHCPGSPGTCNPQGNGLPGLPMSWSPTIFTGSGPVRLPLVPCTEKTIEMWQFFVLRGSHCCRGDLAGRTTFWIFFFLVACKS